MYTNVSKAATVGQPPLRCSSAGVGDGVTVEKATPQRRNLMLHHLQAAFVELIDQDPAVVTFIAQPALIFEFRHRGRLMFWAPAFLTGDGGRSVLWDFSCDLAGGRVRAAWAELELREKLAWIAEREGYRYAIATPRRLQAGIFGLRRAVSQDEGGARAFRGPSLPRRPSMCTSKDQRTRERRTYT